MYTKQFKVIAKYYWGFYNTKFGADHSNPFIVVVSGETLQWLQRLRDGNKDKDYKL